MIILRRKEFTSVRYTKKLLKAPADFRAISARPKQGSLLNKLMDGDYFNKNVINNPKFSRVIKEMGEK